MPRLDGFGATRAIIEQAPTGPRPRIVAMTADALEGTSERCLDAGFDDHLGKPAQLEAMTTAISAARRR